MDGGREARLHYQGLRCSLHAARLYGLVLRRRHVSVDQRRLAQILKLKVSVLSISTLYSHYAYNPFWYPPKINRVSRGSPYSGL